MISIHLIKKTYLIILGLIISMACNNDQNINETTDNPVTSNYSNFNKFYFFEQGDSYNNVIQKLSEKNIDFVNIDLKDIDEIFYPIGGRFILISSEDLIKTNPSLKIIEIRNLNILNKNIPGLQIGFVNDIIFYAKYESNAEAFEENNHKFKNIDYFNRDLLQELVKAYREKLGTPYLEKGSFNISHPEDKLTSPEGINQGDLLIYTSIVTWINKDSTMHLSYSYDYQKTLSKGQISSFSDIEIVFNRDLAFEIERNARLLINAENQLNDSILNAEKNKRKNQLEEL